MPSAPKTVRRCGADGIFKVRPLVQTLKTAVCTEGLTVFFKVRPQRRTAFGADGFSKHPTTAYKRSQPTDEQQK